MITPLTYSPTLGAILDASGKRVAACESDTIGKAIVLAVNTVLLIDTAKQPANLVACIGWVDMEAATQVCRAASAVRES